MKGRISTDNREFWEIGFTGSYIQDHPFLYFCEIPVEAAVAWVKKYFPDINMGNGILARDLTVGDGERTDAMVNGWLNKLFVLVDNPHNWLAIVKWDDRFLIYEEK